MIKCKDLGKTVTLLLLFCFNVYIFIYGSFMTIMEGAYKDKMFELFGEERTETELQEIFKFDFFERSGGGIGVTRLIRSMKMEGLM